MTKFSFPLLNITQSQKEYVHNQSWQLLDSLLHLTIEERDVNTPPISPQSGKTWLIGTQPQGEWQNHSGYIAIWQASEWRFFLPTNGMLIWHSLAQQFIQYDGQVWNVIEGSIDSSVNQLGINTIADDNNILAVKSENVLLSAIASGGGDMQCKVNKEGVSGMASVLFQSDYKGCAEFGCFENEALILKTSADGQNFSYALKILPDTGRLAFKSLSGLTEVKDYKINNRFQITKQISLFNGTPSSQMYTAEDAVVVLPPMELGDWIFIATNETTGFRIYAAPGDTIVNYGCVSFHAPDYYEILNGQSVMFFAAAPHKWYSSVNTE